MLEDKIKENAQKYLRTTKSPLLNTLIQKPHLKETTELVYKRVQTDGLKATFCGHDISLKPENLEIPKIKFSTEISGAGEYNPENHTILLSTSLLKDPQGLYSTLVHEAIHSIQHQLVNEKDKYHKNSPEHALLTVMESELLQREPARTWQNINYGPRIYCASKMTVRGQVSTPTDFAYHRASPIYNTLETERQSRLAEIEWAKLSGIFPQKDIDMQQAFYEKSLKDIQQLCRASYLSLEATLSAFQHAQYNVAADILPDKNKSIEADMTYEITQISALFNEEITLEQYNDRVSSQTKEDFCHSHGLLANTSPQLLETVPLMTKNLDLELDVKNISVQDPSNVVLALLTDSQNSLAVTDDQLIIMFKYLEASCYEDHRVALKQKYPEQYKEWEQKHMKEFDKIFLTPQQMEKHYTTPFPFDMLGEKTYQSSGEQTQNGQSLHFER